jgi:uncharacterized protein YegL
MRENYTHIIFVMDRSGSMQTIWNDAVGAYNSMIQRQKEEPGEATFTLVAFENDYTEVLHDMPIKDVPELDTTMVFPRGGTSLLDAIGRTIRTASERWEATREENKPSRVLVVIMTDGQENSSSQFNRAQVSETISGITNRDNNRAQWEVIFLGANMDAIGEAMNFGLSPTRSANFTASATGVSGALLYASNTMSMYRSKGIVEDMPDSIEPTDKGV